MVFDNLPVVTIAAVYIGGDYNGDDSAMVENFLGYDVHGQVTDYRFFYELVPDVGGSGIFQDMMPASNNCLVPGN